MVGLGAALWSSATLATPSIVIDADTGAVLSSEDAGQPWYPASLTKLMTVYVALSAVRDGYLTLDTPMKVSAYASRMPPSKMGFAPGTELTLGNALKMLMVKSANDIAVVVAEAISGSVSNFAVEMNRQAARLDLRSTHFVNPNGLQNPEHYSSARDLAILARALLHDFPQYSYLYDIGAMDLDGKVIPTHNGLLGRYPGADGMKTGFTCSSGFNVVATATQNGHKLITVVLGSPTAKLRTEKAARLFNAGFANEGNSQSLVSQIPDLAGTPPDMHGVACSRRSKNAILAAETEDMDTPIAVSQGQAGPANPLPSEIMSLPKPVFTPVSVYLGPPPGWTGEALSAANPAIKPLPSTASAYAPPAPDSVSDSPLRVDPAAKPLRLTGAAPEPKARPVQAKTAAHAVAGKKAIKIIRKPVRKLPAHS